MAVATRRNWRVHRTTSGSYSLGKRRQIVIVKAKTFRLPKKKKASTEPPRRDIQFELFENDVIMVQLEKQATPGSTVMSAVNPDVLATVRFIRPHILKMDFADGFTAAMNVAKLGMPTGIINWSSARVSADGTVVTFKGVRGDSVPVDAATFRYLTDRVYATKMDETLKLLQLSEEELERFCKDAKPPQDWFDEPEGDIIRESWK